MTTSVEREEFRLAGSWWLPSKPEEVFDGTIERDGNGVSTLTFQTHLPEGWDDGVILNGIAGGEEFSVFDCWEMGGEYRQLGKPLVRMQGFGGLLRGCLVSSSGQRSFRAISFRFDRLRDVVSQLAISTDKEEAADGSLGKVKHTWSQLNPMTAHAYGWNISLVHVVSSQSAQRGQSVQLSNDPALSAASRTRVSSSLDELLEHERPLRDLVSLLSRHPVRTEGVLLTTNVASGANPVVFLPGGAPLQGAASEPRFRRPYSFIDRTEAEFEALIRTWYRFHRTYSTPVALRFAGRYAPHTYSEVNFTTAVQALEAFNRRRFPASKDKESARMREAVLKQLDGDELKWTKQRLAFAHELSQKKRLEQTLDFIGRKAVGQLVTNRAHLIKTVIETRNLLTHWDPTRAPFDPEAAVALSSGLYLLGDFCFLRSIGWSKSKVWQLALRDHDVQMAQHNLSNFGY